MTGAARDRPRRRHGSSACSVAARDAAGRRARRGRAGARGLGARLVDRRRRPLARPAREAAVRQHAHRRHAGGADRDAGARAVTRCSTCTAPRRRRGRVEIANDSPAPFVVAFVVRGRRAARRSRTACRSSTGGPRSSPRAGRRAGRPSTDGSTEQRGHERAGAPTGRSVASRPWRRASSPRSCTRSRTARRSAPRWALAPSGLGVDDLDLARAPGRGRRGAGVARAARPRHAGRAARPGAAAAVDAGARRRAARRAGVDAGPEVVAALEDWGFDAEAAAAWPRLPGGPRRRLGQAHAADRPIGTAVDRGRRRSVARRCWRACRAAALRRRDGRRGRAAPARPGRSRGAGSRSTCGTRRRAGPVSFSVRWHGERPALLWEAPPGTRLTAPGLDAAWSSDAGSRREAAARLSRGERGSGRIDERGGTRQLVELGLLDLDGAEGRRAARP